MIENIKVDIIYYMTATDFEFEFNLGGCCRMRLLNDKVNDKKGFVNSLARAVSRSQIILAVGPLFGEDGLITTAAAAISHGLATVDNKAYGIASDEKIDIIEGAVPLVTPEGYFGGCIIESGNQSIVLLTENRTVRKAIMKTLVHPYIEDMCIMQSVDRSDRAPIAEVPAPVAPPVPAVETPVAEEPEAAEIPAPEAPETDETPAPTAAVTEILEETPAAEEAVTEVLEETPAAEEISEEDNPEVSEEESEEPEDTEEVQDIADEIEQADPNEHNMDFEFFEDEDETSEDAQEPAPDTEEAYFVPSEAETEPEAGPKKGKGLSIAILIVCILLLLVVFAICYFLVFLPMIGGMSTAEYFKEIFNTVSKV